MPRIEGYAQVLQEDPHFDISVTESNMTVSNGFYTINSGITTQVGSAIFSCDYNVTLTVNPDNSVRFKLDNVHWNNYVYTTAGNYNTPFVISLDAINNDGGLHRVLTKSFAAQTSFTESLNYASDIIREGVVIPNIQQNATAEVLICHYLADGSVSDDEANVGIRIINDLPPTYRPKAVYDCNSGKFLTTNREGGTIKMYDCESKTWKEVRTANGGRTPADMPAAVYDCTKDAFANQHQVGQES